MTRNIIAFIALSVVGLCSIACGDRAAAPQKETPAGASTAPTSTSSLYTVLSETPQPPGSLLATIQVPRSAREPEVKAAVESFVATKRAQYSTIAVRTFFEGASEADSPYAISRVKGDTIKHEFFSSAVDKKIPTH